jgi:hypothetical protein
VWTQQQGGYVMRIRYISLIVVLITLFTVVTASAGDPDSSSDPNFTSPYTADNTNGTVTADVLTGKTYWGQRTDGSGGSSWGLVIGTRYPAPVEKTGQTTSYGTRDDGELERGVSWPTPRLTDNGDGTVTDNLTGLVWLRNTNCFGTRTWTEALSDANGLASGSCGLTDGSTAGIWRLPNVRELSSLMDFSRYNPALPGGHTFTGVQPGYYWSSTTHAPTLSFAWVVSMYDGYVVSSAKSSAHWVWPVREGNIYLPLVLKGFASSSVVRQ